MPIVNKGKFQRVPFPLAPFNEQKRIVAEIEKQFSRLDEAVENLQRVKANLKRYKASVLKAAVEGKLTEQWRAENPDVEPASQLLERILKERRKKWEENELVKMKTKNKEPKDEKWKKRYKEPLSLKNNSEKIPHSWAPGTLEQITDGVRVICYGILMPKKNVPDGVLYVKVKDMKGDKINLAGLNRTSPIIAKKYERASLNNGDILLSIRGTYGRVANVPPELNGGNITQDTARLDITPLIDTDFAVVYLRSPETQFYFKKVARGVAVKGVNIADVRLTPFYIPPKTEQVAIVDEVNRLLSFVDEIESYIEKNLQRADRLRQSILKKAFSGKLINNG